MGAIPRYSIGKGPLSYEVPVVRAHDGGTVAILSVSASGWPSALQTAITWSLDRAVAEERRTNKFIDLRPEVRYVTAGENKRRIAKRIDGAYVWTETRYEGPSAWLPVDVVHA